jgi:integrase
MAHLLQPRWTKRNPHTGEKETRRTRRWYGVWRDSQGTRHRVPLSENKQAAAAMLVRAMREKEQELAGLRVPARRQHTLEGSLAEWQESLRAKGGTARYVRMTAHRAHWLVGQCGFRQLADLAPLPVEAALARLRNEQGRSVQTSNFYLAALAGFSRWLVRNGRLPTNPLATLCRGNVRTDRRHDRRALSEEEFRRLLASTSNSRRVLCGLAGPARALLYATAASTGLRASELASLTPASFSLSESPTVRCRAAYTKNGQDALLPLPPSLVAPLRAFLADKRADKPVWGKEWPKHAARTIRKDEQDAGVAYETADGFADFHSLRHLFITSLFRVGVHPRTAQVLARHSTIVLTMAIYTKPGNEAIEAVGRLPSCVPACVPVLSDGIRRGS